MSVLLDSRSSSKGAAYTGAMTRPRLGWIYLPVAALIAFGVAAGVAQPKAAPSVAKELRRYVTALDPVMRKYKAAARRVDQAYLEMPTATDLSADFGKLVIRLRASEAEFRSLASAFARIRAPAALRSSHAKETEALKLSARLLGLHAGLFEEMGKTSDDRTALLAVYERGQAERQALAGRANALQKAWAASVRNALKRARLSLPWWMEEMLPGS